MKYFTLDYHVWPIFPPITVLLFIASENNQKIVVRVKNSDYIEFGDVEFNYYVTGVRDGFEDIEPLQALDASKNVIL